MRVISILPMLSACVLPVLLAGCDKGGDVSLANASQEEVAAKVEAATAGGNGVNVKPGRWEGQLSIQELDIPGLPPQAREQMKAQMGQDQKFVSCVTDEDVKSNRAFFTGNRNDKSCTYDRFDMTGGKIDAAMRCDRGGDGKLAMTMNGSYAPESYQMNMASTADGAGPMAKMSMKMSVAAKRVGDCKGTPDESHGGRAS